MAWHANDLSIRHRGRCLCNARHTASADPTSVADVTHVQLAAIAANRTQLTLKSGVVQGTQWNTYAVDIHTLDRLKRGLARCELFLNRLIDTSTARSSRENRWRKNRLLTSAYQYTAVHESCTQYADIR
jgi:hypothetical protein